MADLREKRIDLILQQVEELPTLPAVALRVMEVTADGRSSAREVVELIGSDPTLTARIMQLVRRADVGARNEVASVERAVVLLGFDAVRNAVLAVSVFQAFAGPPGSESSTFKTRFDREEFWKHCVAVACCAELLAEAAATATPGGATSHTSGFPSPSDAFICGLLHDLGKVALDAVLPKSYSRVVEAADLLRGNIADLERTVIGLDHLVVGKRLAERWRLPAAVRDCAWLHGQPPQALPAHLADARLVNLVTLANALVRERHLGYSGNYTQTVDREALLSAIGLSGAQVASALQHLVTRIEPRSSALGLGRASSEELYEHALAQANTELGRVNRQLASKSRKLTARSKFFDVLSQFQANLRPDAAPLSVLQSIVTTAAGALGVPTVAAFSLPPGQDYAENVIFNVGRDGFESSLVDLPGMSAVTADSTVGARTGSDLPVAGGELPVAGAELPVASCQLAVGHLAPPALIDQTPSASLATGNRQLATLPPSPQLTTSPSPSPSPFPGDGPVLPAGESIEWLVSAISPRLPHDKRFWICLEADGALVGGVVWGAEAGEAQRLGAQAPELMALASGWGLALRTAQVRDEARTLAEQLADANRRLHDAQAELLRSKAMLTVGEMAAGAAHEMNNPLAVISGRSQLLASQLSDPKQQAAARLIYEQSHRLSAIITDMMDFAKPQPPVIRDTEVAGIIEAALREAKARNDPADRRIEVTADGVPRVSADPAQVSAAIAEVVSNAIQATSPAGGSVTVHAAHDPYSERVVITVADDGCGMDERTALRAFDPFYSNKPAGRRRGLGLAKALRWVEAGGGGIRLESQPGHGTRVIVLLPVAKVEPVAGEPRRRAAQ